MDKKIKMLVVMLLALPCIVYSASLFIIQETEKISLAANASDPDLDKLTVSYGHPLNDQGEWLTTYGDEGEYKTTVTVSDGLNWYVDGSKKQEGREFLYDTGYNDAGSHKIKIVVKDKVNEASKEWTVDAENIDVESLLKEVRDVTVEETETARLSLPDFGKYGLKLAISEPLGDKNEWKTGFDENGTYNTRIHVEGKGFRRDKIVKITVKDTDRPLDFFPLENKIVNENDEVRILLKAHDDDNDEIFFSAENMPAGALLEGNTFTWKPGFDSVKREDFVDKVMDKLSVLSKSYYIKFIASSRGKNVVQNAIITVKDVNQAPFIEDIIPLFVDEGSRIRLSPNYYDADGDKVSVRYSGFMDRDTRKTGFEDSGSYFVKVEASDGHLTSSKFAQVTINNVNRQPILKPIPALKTVEGEQLAFFIEADDPDGDKLSFDLDNTPNGSSIKGNVFIWDLHQDIAENGKTKRIDLVFVASDGNLEARQIAKIEVANKNSPPKILDSSKSISAKINQPVLLFVKAIDADGDEMTYTWDFGFLEKYSATANHQRTFTSPGNKVVKVIVSDGKDRVEQTMNVNVA